MRDRNEDRWLARRHATTLLLAVADGVGGEDGGDVASSAAIEALTDGFAPPSFRDSARTALATAVERANAAVLAAAARAAMPRAATTLVAAALRGRELAVANLGDSRAYIVRGGEIRQLTSDHSGDRTSSITRFLGDPRGVQPDIFVETLRPGDRIVLCSDGLTRHVSDAEIARAVAGPSGRAADALVALANERGGEDNITVLVHALPRQGLPRPLAGLLILALLLLVAIAGALGALLSTPPRPAPAAPTPATSEAPAGSATPVPTASP